MELRPYIEQRLAQTYSVTGRLVNRLNDDDLGWKPATGTNWMTVGQLLEHLAGCGGLSFQGVVDGSFATMPVEVRDAGPDAGLPPAEALPSVPSVDDARRRIAADRELAERLLAGTTDADLESRPAPVWWDPRPMTLGPRMLDMIDHFVQHKGQLFYYVKLMGHDVGTADLYGI